MNKNGLPLHFYDFERQHDGSSRPSIHLQQLISSLVNLGTGWAMGAWPRLFGCGKSCDFSQLRLMSSIGGSL